MDIYTRYLGEKQADIRVVEKKLRDTLAVRDIDWVHVDGDTILFRVALEQVPEDKGYYVDREGYSRVKAYMWNDEWRLAVRRRMTTDLLETP